MSILSEYQALTVELKRAQSLDDQALEDSILDKMDVIWYSCSAEEKEQVNNRNRVTLPT